ncbi:MAG TPA: hypothetical protein VGD52_04080 [Pseudoduganella sp.]
MSNVAHGAWPVTDSEMVLRRISLMKLSKGSCDKNSFGPPKITLFQNAASTGDLKLVEQFLARGINVNITDFGKGDTALIKSAKILQGRYCKCTVSPRSE